MNVTIQSMFLGALFVVIGVLAAAAADRIRGVRWTKERDARAPRERGERTELRVIENPRKKEPDGHGGMPMTDAHKKLRADVIGALTTSGFSKAEAIAAVDGCPGNAQSTIDSWMRAALKRTAA